MKPKMYQKTKPTKMPKNFPYKNIKVDGDFKFVDGPVSSVGDKGAHSEKPSVEHGEKKLEVK
jgi:hypothetical protein